MTQCTLLHTSGLHRFAIDASVCFKLLPVRARTFRFGRPFASYTPRSRQNNRLLSGSRYKARSPIPKSAGWRTSGQSHAAMMTATRASSTSSKVGEKKRPAIPRPSASIVLLSSTNQVLLLHRVQTSSAFPSAHVFPGGNISEFHDGPVPPWDDPKRHEDSVAYRLGAIRETFEESGILLARAKDGSGLLNLPAAEREAARKHVYSNEARFVDWVESVGGILDAENLHPFTRWITPAQTPKRFTTQMYLYMLPLARSPSGPALEAVESEATVPTPDGTEIMKSAFDDASVWLERQMKGGIIVFPPQVFLLTIVAKFCTGPPPSSSVSSPGALTEHYQSQRGRLLDFLHQTPTATHPLALKHFTAQIPWAEKVISPVMKMVQGDRRTVLGLEKPGPELQGSGRGGDYERVVLVEFTRGVPRKVEVKSRKEISSPEKLKQEPKL